MLKINSNYEINFNYHNLPSKKKKKKQHRSFCVAHSVSLTSFKLSASAFCSCVIDDFKLLFSSSNSFSLSVFFLMSAARSPAKT